MKVLVVAVHPDDESLGAGGTLLKHKANGDEIHWLIITKSENEEFQKVRNQEISKVNTEYSFTKVHELGFSTTKLNDTNFSDIVSSIGRVLAEVAPEVIYVPFFNDVHTDHQVVSKALGSCTKTFRYPSVKRVLMMETISETEFALNNPAQNFSPNYFVDISDHIDQKIKILNIYKSEMGEAPFPRSNEVIRALAIYRGSTCNSSFAESFMLLKEIVK
jgi:LmbE family N-acetylglucosaminyl deacetylase